MCKQTCQVSRNLCECPQKAGDLQASRKCKKISRNRGNLIVLDLQQLPELISATTPPPSEPGPLMEITENVYYYHPPPPPNLVGFRRPRKMYRLESAGCPPPTKILATPLSRPSLHLHKWSENPVQDMSETWGHHLTEAVPRITRELKVKGKLKEHGREDIRRISKQSRFGDDIYSCPGTPPELSQMLQELSDESIESV